MRPSVLVASDGTPAALGALKLALQLETEASASIELFGVVEPVPVFDAGFLVAIPETELYQGRQKALRGELESQLEEVAGAPDAWPIRVETGVPGPRIVKRAEDIGATVILMGMGRHRPMDRLFGTETALQVIRVSHIPVLAVPQDAIGLPRSAALGIDFSHFSHRAAVAAMFVMKTPWEAHLVHVLSGMEFLPTISQEWRADYEDELLKRLSELGEAFARPEGCELSYHLLEGEPGNELLAFTKDRSVELLVAGSHGLSFIGRLLMGSVSTRLIRGADVPVLVVPPADLTQEALQAQDAPPSRHPWVRLLDDFSRENVGRLTSLRFSGLEVGQQECGRGLPLMGVDFDPRKNRLEIMLGRSGTVEGHLTHSLPDPERVEVDRDEAGRSTALRVKLVRGALTLKVHRGDLAP